MVTNGLGGFASGTISGLLTRRYHGLLVAALEPPLGRTLLLVKLDETVVYHEQSYPLFANRWVSGQVEPAGYHHLEQFCLEGAIPVWTFGCGDALLEKRVWLEPEANTTYIHYTLRRATGPLKLTLQAMLNYRDYHHLTHANGWQMQITPEAQGLKVIAFEGAAPFYILSDQGQAVPNHTWHQNFYLSEEARRGLNAAEDHLCGGAFEAYLTPDQPLTLVASMNPTPDLDGRSAYTARRAYEQRLIGLAQKAYSKVQRHLPAWLEQLVLAADHFIVSRPLRDLPSGHTIIAGYPWFGDWGRDTMLALPGLTLCLGRPDIARSILQTFARFSSKGMLPNRFPETGGAPDYNTVDSALWYFHAIHQYLRFTHDQALITELYPLLVEMIEWHQKGTRYKIRVDAKDGLLQAGEPGLQLTWMDAKIGEWVITPRIGKPVEVNALWHNALQVMALLSRKLGKNKAAKAYKQQADFMAENFRRRFWFAAGGYLCDVIDGPGGDPGPDGKLYDRRLRPNQILAVSLPFKLLDDDQAKAVVDSCTRHLLTPYGLRTLAPDDPAYAGRYSGNQYERDSAYHQGTVWSWLIGPFVKAHLKVYCNPALAQSYLQPLIDHLGESGCIGAISEIFDGDPPFTPRGGFARAWSVAELITAWRETAEG